jgi:uncharacterized protein with GYD domain
VPTYILFSVLSPQGIQTLRATPERVLEVNREIEEMGATVVQQWALLGSYDFMTIVEAPDERVLMRVSSELAARGSALVESITVIPVDDLISDLTS